MERMTEFTDDMKYIIDLEEENRKLDEAYQIARDRVIELLGDIEQYLEHIKELEEENKKLKADLEECECSMHFENDEVGYRKRECKRLREELNKKNMETWFDEKAENIYKSQKENILMGKI